MIATAIVALAAGGAWLGQGWWTVGRFIESTDDAYVGGDVTTIAPHTAGFVSEILVTDNAHVLALNRFTGGLIVGEIYSITSMINPAFSDAMLFVAMTMVLLLRPQGLLGTQSRE